MHLYIKKRLWQITPRQAALLYLKYPSIELFLSALFKRFWNLTIRVQNSGIILKQHEIFLKTMIFLPPDCCICIKGKDFGYTFHSYFNILYI